MVVLLGACAGPNDPSRHAKMGAGIGAVTGAVLGHQISHGSGKWVGAAVGALAGAAIGDYMDEQQRDFEQELAVERNAHQIRVERLADRSLRLTLDSEVSFDVDKADIRRSFRPSLNRLAAVIRRYDRTVVHIIGHTDSTGSDDYNQELSEERADRVASYLESRGVPPERVIPEGRGEREPRADNSSAAGRQLNRRVEIYIKPVEEGHEAEAYEPPHPHYGQPAYERHYQESNMRRYP
jgi:outer membrane protein OmpA-like peptidoglycan-associated protein